MHAIYTHEHTHTHVTYYIITMRATTTDNGKGVNCIGPAVLYYDVVA